MEDINVRRTLTWKTETLGLLCVEDGNARTSVRGRRKRSDFCAWKTETFGRSGAVDVEDSYDVNVEDGNVRTFGRGDVEDSYDVTVEDGNVRTFGRGDVEDSYGLNVEDGNVRTFGRR